jgi:hypothetical protein
MNIDEVRSAFVAEVCATKADASPEGIDELQARLEARKNDFLSKTSDDELKKQIVDLADRVLWSFSVAMLTLLIHQKVATV